METNTYQFVGVVTTTYVRPPVTHSPLPSPNPTVTAVQVLTTVSNVDSTSGNVFPPTGESNLMEFSATETDTGILGQLGAVPITSQTYYRYVADHTPGLTDVYVVGSQTQRQPLTLDQVSYTTVYGNGNGLLDVVPEPSQTGQSVSVGPPNNASLTTSEQDPDGQVTTRTVAADGSYQENVNYPDGTTATAYDKPNLAGFLSWPLKGNPGGENSSVTVSAPSGGQIPILVVYGKGVLDPNKPVSVQTSVPVWYPPSKSLYQQTYVNKGPTALPIPFPSPTPPNPPIVAGVCSLDVNPRPNLPGKPWSNLLLQTTTTLDPLFGEAETVFAKIWDTQGVGMTCSDTVDTIKQFYDFSGQSYTVPWFQPTPVQVTTIDSQLSVNNASIFPSGWRRGTGLGTRRGGPLHTGAGTRNVQGVSSRTQAPLGLVPRGMMPVALARLERERLKRHAMFWRQLKALESKRVMW